MAKVLLAETDSNMAPLLLAQLALDGHEIVEVADLSKLAAAVHAACPDLVVVRLESDGDRLQPLRQLRTTSLGKRLPIVALQAHVIGAQRYEAFQLDVDDVVTEPFDAREVRLRVSAILRWSADRPRLDLVEELPKDGLVQAGPFTLRSRELKIMVYGEEVLVTRTQMRLMLAMAEKLGRACEADWLHKRVWGDAEEGEGPQQVQWHVNNLRKKLGPHGRHITTIRKVGYCLDPLAA
jgi:DNA-binding response OmpR family regulator